MVADNSKVTLKDFGKKIPLHNHKERQQSVNGVYISWNGQLFTIESNKTVVIDIR